MKLKYKLNWNFWDWAARRLSASRRGKSVQEGGKSRPHAMPIYPLSPTARTNPNSPYNRSCNTRSPRAPRKQRFPCLLGGCCCHQYLLQSPSAHCTSILLLLHFLVHSTHSLLKSHLVKRLCSTKELILTRFHVSITPFCTTVATT